MALLRVCPPPAARLCCCRLIPLSARNLAATRRRRGRNGGRGTNRVRPFVNTWPGIGLVRDRTRLLRSCPCIEQNASLSLALSLPLSHYSPTRIAVSPLGAGPQTTGRGRLSRLAPPCLPITAFDHCAPPLPCPDTVSTHSRSRTACITCPLLIRFAHGAAPRTCPVFSVRPWRPFVTFTSPAAGVLLYC